MASTRRPPSWLQDPTSRGGAFTPPRGAQQRPGPRGSTARASSREPREDALRDNVVMRLLTTPMSSFRYGAVEDEDSLSEAEASDAESDGSLEGDAEQDELEEDPGIVEVLVEWADLHPPICAGKDEQSFQIELVQGPNIKLLKQFLQHAPPPVPLPPEEVQQQPRSFLETLTGRFSTPAPHVAPTSPRSSLTSDPRRTSVLSSLHGDLELPEAPRPVIDVRATHRRSGYRRRESHSVPVVGAGGDSRRWSLLSTPGTQEEEEEEDPEVGGERATVLWDQLFDFERLGNRRAEAESEAEKEAHEAEELELLQFLDQSGQMGQKDLLSSADGLPMDVEKDLVLDADFSLLVRLWDKEPPPLDTGGVARPLFSSLASPSPRPPQAHTPEPSLGSRDDILPPPTSTKGEGDGEEANPEAGTTAACVAVTPGDQPSPRWTRRPGAPAVLVAQSLIVVDHLHRLACLDRQNMPVRWHELHSPSERSVGRVRIGLRFAYSELEGVHAEAETWDEEMGGMAGVGSHGADASRRVGGRVPRGAPSNIHEAELLARRIFLKYDITGDGYLTRSEFQSFIEELNSVGGNIKALKDADDGSSCLGYCIPLPDLDLMQYIKHRHTLLVVCFDRRQRQIKSTFSERLAVVAMSLLWSLASNCLVEVYMHTDRMWQVATITIVDTFGTSVLAGVFLVSHWTYCRRCWFRNSFGKVLPLAIFIIFLAFFSGWLLVAMRPDQLYSSVYSFLPIWATARLTEVFKLGTYWAFMVQYGSSASGRKARAVRLRREKKQQEARQRRARLLGAEDNWWNGLRWPWQQQQQQEEEEEQHQHHGGRKH
uniref:EF-hand domain-containing protein n=1 Tax=Rhizochromulina marina TaxID=1034831 RepID=A0A7S2W4H5_9STRA|mmetsp:Transcript_14652/g.43358  ORF Transcript_14652/g.43358 Transcript_14652/m.43358 type:complete len:825 (+) Transcript_14652:97-2571(+)|eukprot:CAMPEP_0118966464 /NCGR_PEP_ID=MMETSP1173-20130426/3933_1 /TAXON_ID=1034831 /ORGANISM="Rhizochromulina marina cf, Strain CCMP1243" /LENGTH=824 /DNA_ID=CAMNT_0006915255 /DNA_START=32 /DNA_END=2506 /DNA_ORIENTATION=-